MEILSVTLSNFKSHRDRHFVFQPGTNAICGENGAGKTSILEAIAWTLFDYTGDYTKDDLIHNGAASAQVTVTFVSSRDQRTYQVSRCTRSGYTIYDPQLNERLPHSRIKEDVVPWLREHLGVPAGTDLGKLFASTIGVPQGTFTADFLLTAEKRKPIFDKILKVEEYQQTWKKLADLEKYAKHRVEALQSEIAHYDEDLKDWESLTLKRFDLHQDVEQTQRDLQHWQQQLATLQVERDRLAALEAQLQQLTGEIQQKTAQIQVQSHLRERMQSELQQAEQAVAICTQHRESYRAFLQAEEDLKALEHSRRTQQQLMEQRQTLLATLSDRQSQLATLTHQLDRLTTAKSAIQDLVPLIQQQTQLEQQQQALIQQLQECQLWRQTIKREEKRATQLLTKHTELTAEIERLSALEATVQQIPELENLQQRYQQQLSRVAAAVQFEADLRQIVTLAQTERDRHALEIQAAEATLRDLQQATPLWMDAIEQVQITLRTGVTLQGQLMTDLQEILNDLAEQVSSEKLQHQLEQVQQQLRLARQQQAHYLTLDAKVQEQTRVNDEAIDLQTHLEKLRTQLAAEADLTQQKMHLAEQLTALNNPRGRSQLLHQELQAQPQLEASLQTVQQSVTETHAAIADLDTQLSPLANLSEQFQTQQAIREQYRPTYQLYLEHQQLANSFRQRQAQLEATTQQLHDLQQEMVVLADKRAQLTETFDVAEFQAIQKAYQEADKQQITLSAKLPEKLKLLADYDSQLTRLTMIRDKRAHAEGTLKQQVKTEKFIRFARRAYKEAGPRITERYVHNISWEADRLFRELLNRPNVSLEWTRDYEIIVQEEAHTRRLINLSGGEQMCAALAVRLALLKVLADIDIAFFDEPTTNMDKPRREQLADAIANIKNFRQLFVISHDDTFEKVTENIIWVEREV